jgi:hypothetical protein
MVECSEDYVREVKSVFKNWGSSKHLFFRGHGSSEVTTLLPSVFRDNLYSEKEILHDFKQYAPAHSINYDFIAERDKVLADMQQYGIPTRLLDWTLAPLNALFFACSNDEDTDGQVIVFNHWEYWNKIVRDSEKEKPEIHHIHILSRALLSGGWQFEKIKNYIDQKYQYNDLIPGDIEKPFAFIANYTNTRILHQRGCYSIQGSDTIALDKVPEALGCIYRIDIQSKHKKQIMTELNQLYINHYSIYPDFEGMKRMILIHKGLFNTR